MLYGLTDGILSMDLPQVAVDGLGMVTVVVPLAAQVEEPLLPHVLHAGLLLADLLGDLEKKKILLLEHNCTSISRPLSMADTNEHFSNASLIKL